MTFFNEHQFLIGMTVGILMTLGCIALLYFFFKDPGEDFPLEP